MNGSQPKLVRFPQGTAKELRQAILKLLALPECDRVLRCWYYEKDTFEFRPGYWNEMTIFVAGSRIGHSRSDGYSRSDNWNTNKLSSLERKLPDGTWEVVWQSEEFKRWWIERTLKGMV